MESIAPIDLVTAAVRKLGGVQAGETVSDDELNDGVSACNLLIDSWATDGLTIPTNLRQDFPIASGQDALTIGVGGALNTQRPMSIDAASILLNGPSAITLTSLTNASGVATATKAGHGYSTGMSIMISGANQSAYNGPQVITVSSSSVFTFPVIGSPTTPATGTVTARDMTGDNATLEMYLSQWTQSGWIAQSIKGQTNPYPTRFYYEPIYSGELGIIYIWPNPTQANVFVLYTPSVLTALDVNALATAVVMPPGYIRALIYNLAVELAPEYGTNIAAIPSVPQLAQTSLASIKRQNDRRSELSTGTAGLMFGAWRQGWDGPYNIFTGP